MSLRSVVPALALASAHCVCAAAAANEPPIVTAGGETLAGQWLAPGEAVFRGIPDSAAPVGDLRWRPPAPHRPRAGRQSALEFAPACVQTERLYDWERSIATANDTATTSRRTPAASTSRPATGRSSSARASPTAALPQPPFRGRPKRASGWQRSRPSCAAS